jgi:hypothetical protein
MSRSFVNRLDSARTPEKCPDIKRVDNNSRSDKKANVPRFAIQEENENKPASNGANKQTDVQSKREYNNKSDILDKLSEYLFDLFDANVMADYIKMEKFEMRALESFQKLEDDEFTHEQHALHCEFVSLFEELIEEFLKAEGYTIDVFYDELVHFRKSSCPQVSANAIKYGNGSSSTFSSPADEVMEVISGYMQFEVWAGLMRAQAKQRAAFLSTREKLSNAAEKAAASTSIYEKNISTEYCLADTKSSAHRLNDAPHLGASEK